MSALRAQLVTAAEIAVATVVLVLTAQNVLSWNGTPGWTLQPAGHPFVVEIASVDEVGAAARAGLRAGDRVDLRQVSFDDRVLLVASPVAHHPFELTVERGGADRRVVVVANPQVTSWDGWIGNFVLLWMAAFAALIGWLRPQMREARLLSLVLSAYVTADALQFFVTPSATFDVLVTALNWGGVFGGLTLALLVRFAGSFGASSRARRTVDGVAYAGAALLAVYGIAAAVSLGTAWFDPVPLWFGTTALAIICGAQILVLISGACAIAAARGVERQRVGWAMAAIGPLLAAEVLQLILNAAFPTVAMTLTLQVAVNVLAVLAPIGLTYSVLSRRLLDIGFVINRAAVYSVVSVTLVGTFMIVEWALGNWLASIGHVTSTAFSVALAVALGFSVRFVHERAEQLVDTLFHRKHAYHVTAADEREALEAEVRRLREEVNALRAAQPGSAAVNQSAAARVYEET